MKTLISLLTTTMLVAGATDAMALDRQATDDAADYAISQQAAQRGAFASTRLPGETRHSAVVAHDDIQLDGR